MPAVSAWQNRPLSKAYPFTFMDAIHYRVQENQQDLTQAAGVIHDCIEHNTIDLGVLK
jgi:Transposase, Mutator family.